jgi:hypothetical protein
LTTSGAETAVVNLGGRFLGVPGLVPASPSLTITQTPPAGTLVGPGTHSITLTVTDAAGNSSTCTTNLIVVDTTPPTITACATNKNLTADGNGQASLPNLTSEVSASDNCTSGSALTITQSPAAGTMVGLGTTTVTITVKDTAGNMSTCTATVTVTAPPTSADFFLHGTGPNNNPPTLFLNLSAPTAASAKFRDSPGLSFGSGNPWKEIGTWTAAPALTAGTLTALGDLHVWLGLQNSDDQGTRFDLRAEIYKNGMPVAAGETYCIMGIVRNPNQAKEATVTFAPFTPVTLNGTSDTLSLKVLTRIGSDGAGGFCGGHSNAVGLRLYFDAVSRPARFGATTSP